MFDVQQRYNRRKAERRFARVYKTAEGDRCIYCGIPSDGKYDHQPPVYVLHRFADGRPVTQRAIRERFGQCKLVPCCTICNMALGAYHGSDDNDRRKEIVNWFLLDERIADVDSVILDLGYRLLTDRTQGTRGAEVYKFPGVGRAIFIEALVGFIDGTFRTSEDFPEWLTFVQSELATWLRGDRNRKSAYFLAMANLESYDLRPHARVDPRGQFGNASWRTTPD